MYKSYSLVNTMKKAKDEIMKKDEREKFLSKTQEVLYRKEFKHADRIYRRLSTKGNRS